MKAAPLVVLALLFTTAACADETDGGPTVTASPAPQTPSSTTSRPQSDAPPEADTGARVIGTVATGLQAPWGIAFLPDGSALVTERDSGRVLAIRGKGQPREVGTIEATEPQGEAGLMGIAVSPDFAENSRVFVYVTTAEDNRVLSMEYDGRTLGEPTPIFTGIPKGFVHDGGRLTFGPDGGLFVSTGETGEMELAQDPDSLAGKILKITETGDPFAGDSPIWSTGHRNVQGLAFDDRDRLWASEFGADTWDELNLIERGDNYGWPRVEGRSDQREFTNPRAVWRPEEASPSGLAFADGSLWMASLRGERLWQIPITAEGAGKPVDHFAGKYGRLRAVVQAPDGNLWLATSNTDGRGDVRVGDDRILLVRP